ncbi:hypothetical protein BKA82DRAFT_4362687 [Pisolithus tinctorius]|nr:hypothetical protein BKA82DRAFT_4362687 [Pisolithus tinctorius]
MIDGLYDGSSVDLGQYETVLLVAGGSGTTFTLGLLDDIVFKCIKTGRPNGERTRRIEIRMVYQIVWWGLPRFSDPDRPSLTLTPRGIEPPLISISPSSHACVTPKPYHSSRTATSNWTVHLYIHFSETTGRSRPSSLESAEAEEDKPFSAVQPHAGGGVAVCASGPESLVVETRNAVARLSVGNALKLGGVVVHVESFAL